ncbi:MAG TPA: GlxA family transcriptional regulator [Kiloniellaceae bacterium]|nr:GlxA family transcriptional regulator [Kiloniellaceae bacterium]
MPSNQKLEITFLLFEGYSTMVLASAVEPLRAARDLSGDTGVFAWRLVTLDGGPVRSSSGLEVRPDAALAAGLTYDRLILISGYGARHHANKTTIRALQCARRAAAVLGGLDMGAWILAAAGMLDGYRATIHWQELVDFEETFLNVQVTNDEYIIDRNRITAGGASTVMKLMLRLIRDTGGNALAFDVSNLFVYDVEGRFTQSRGARGQRVLRAPQLEAAILSMRQNVEDPLALAEIAAAASVSPRKLDRLFQSELGVSPGRYYRMIRLSLARSLVMETNLGNAEIAVKTGFTSSATLSRAFSEAFGETIRGIRTKRHPFS